MKRSIEPLTALIAVVSIVGVLVLMYLKIETVAGLVAVIGVLTAAQSKKLVRPKWRVTDLKFNPKTKRLEAERLEAARNADTLPPSSAPDTPRAEAVTPRDNLTLPGWTCPRCGTFNGEATGPRHVCRHCDLSYIRRTPKE